MITVTDVYKTAIDADSRHITPLVKVYFDGITATEFTGDEIVSINLLEEANADADNPLGAISSNEITITFDNTSRDFTPTNTIGVYYGKLKPNVKVVPYLGLELPDTTFEYVPLGIFRTGDWSSPSSNLEATVTGYDKLYEIGDEDVPMLPVKLNTTIYGMFEMLFTTLGLTPSEYNIDSSLSQQIAIGWLPKGKVKEALQYLAVAGNCNVTTDRYGVIQVRNNFVLGDAVATITDGNQIITAENPQKYLDVYNSVKVNYKVPELKPQASLVKTESLLIPNGGVILSEIEFSSGPVATIDQVRLIGAINAVITSVEYGAWSMNVQIQNPGSDEVVTLEVLGQAVDIISSTFTAQDTDAIVAWGAKKLEIDNQLIQGLDVARLYANSLLQYVTDPAVNFSLNIRGNPALEVGDIIQIQDTIDKIGTVDVIPVRINLDYDGALSATMQARKPIVPRDWVYVSPGLYAYAVRNINR